MAEVGNAPGISQAALDALAASVPLPATSTPPGVADNGTVGTDTRYALANHTHASKARKQISPISGSGLFTWVYPTPFAAGVIPICNGIAKCPTGTTSLVNVQLEGDPTNTQCVFRVTVYQQSVAALLGLTILSLGTTVPANSSIHMSALEP